VNTAANANVMALTGSTIGWGAALAALVLFIVGAGALVVRRRKA
jgi:LPXTG-motif cell wall-anchored protein